jgi:hypothetical protein
MEAQDLVQGQAAVLAANLVVETLSEMLDQPAAPANTGLDLDILGASSQSRSDPIGDLVAEHNRLAGTYPTFTAELLNGLTVVATTAINRLAAERGKDPQKVLKKLTNELRTREVET